MTGFKLKTKNELVGLLTALTELILKEINTLHLYQANELTNPSQTGLELLISQRRIELEEISKTKSDDRKQYIKVLKKWFSGEKKFVRELETILALADVKRDFVLDMVSGMRQLQKNGLNEACISNVKENQPDKESSFRYWFKNFFSARYPNAIVTAEEEKGNGRIDLKVIIGNNEKIIEFKGWWNSDKAELISQISSYLTDFEKEGYIFMINHLKTKDIVPGYKTLMTQESMGYLQDTWAVHQFDNTDMHYFSSKHKIGVKEKVVYHFIFNVYS